MDNGALQDMTDDLRLHRIEMYGKPPAKCLALVSKHRRISSWHMLRARNFVALTSKRPLQRLHLEPRVSSCNKRTAAGARELYTSNSKRNGFYYLIRTLRGRLRAFLQIYNESCPVVT